MKTEVELHIQTRFELYYALSKITKQTSMPNDVMKSLAIDSAFDIAAKNEIFTERLLELYDEYDINVDDVTAKLRRIVNKHKNDFKVTATNEAAFTMSNYVAENLSEFFNINN